MFSRITLRLTEAIIITLIIGIGLTSFLNYAKFEKIITEFIRSRIDVVLMDIKNTVEFSLLLGLPISDLQNTQDILDRWKDLDEGILSITVADATGQVLFCTDRDRIGEPLARREQPEESQRPEKWLAKKDAALISGTWLTDAINQKVGILSLLYSRAHHDNIVNDALKKLFQVGAIIFLAFSIAAYFVAFKILRKTSHNFRMLDTRMRRLLTDAPTASSTTEVPLVAPPEYLAAYRHFDNAFSALERTSETFKNPGNDGPDEK